MRCKIGGNSFVMMLFVGLFLLIMIAVELIYFRFITGIRGDLLCVLLSKK